MIAPHDILGQILNCESSGYSQALKTPVFNHLGGVTVWTFNAFRPAKVPNHGIALGIINQSVNVHSHPAVKIRLDYLGKLDQFRKV